MILPSPSLASLAPALVAAQAAMPTVVRDKTGKVKGVSKSGPYEYTYQYADLSTIWPAVSAVLAEHGLAVSQFPCTLADGRAGLSTMLVHTSGEWLVDEMPLAVDGAGPQAQGSGITYARRYALCAVLGIVADEDDDGSAAQGSRGQVSSRGTGRRKVSKDDPASGAGREEARAPADRGDNTPPAWHRDLMAALATIGLAGDDRGLRLAYLERVTGRRVESSRELTPKEAGQVIRAVAEQGARA